MLKNKIEDQTCTERIESTNVEIGNKRLHMHRRQKTKRL
jgi:hypothetical protein